MKRAREASLNTKRLDVGGKRGQTSESTRAGSGGETEKETERNPQWNEKEERRGGRKRKTARGCTVASVHAPGAFHNPEYCSRIHIYATSPGDNSAIMRRGRARPTSPSRVSLQPPFVRCSYVPLVRMYVRTGLWLPVSRSLFLCTDALEIVSNHADGRARPTDSLPSWFIQRCREK